MSKYRKALFAALGGAAGAFATAMQDGQVTAAEWGAIAATAAVAGYAVWQVRNKQETPGQR